MIVSIRSKNILALFNVEKGSLIVPNLMVVLGTGALVKILSSSEEFSLVDWVTPLFLLGLPLLVYFIVKTKELHYKSILATQKNVLIMVFPSSLSLLKKVLNIPENEALDKNKFGVKKIYFLVTKNMPVTKEEEEAMLDFLRAYGVKVEIRRVDVLENPKKLQFEFEKIVETIPNKKNCAVNVQTGTKVSSIFLYELARKNNIEVHYLSSLYDKENNPIDGSENLYTLESEYLDKDA